MRDKHCSKPHVVASLKKLHNNYHYYFKDEKLNEHPKATNKSELKTESRYSDPKPTALSLWPQFLLLQIPFNTHTQTHRYKHTQSPDGGVSESLRQKKYVWGMYWRSAPSTTEEKSVQGHESLLQNWQNEVPVWMLGPRDGATWQPWAALHLRIN